MVGSCPASSGGSWPRPPSSRVATCGTIATPSRAGAGPARRLSPVAVGSLHRARDRSNVSMSFALADWLRLSRASTIAGRWRLAGVVVLGLRYAEYCLWRDPLWAGDCPVWSPAPGRRDATRRPAQSGRCGARGGRSGRAAARFPRCDGRPVSRQDAVKHRCRRATRFGSTVDAPLAVSTARASRCADGRNAGPPARVFRRRVVRCRALTSCCLSAGAGIDRTAARAGAL